MFVTAMKKETRIYYAMEVDTVRTSAIHAAILLTK